MASKPRLVARTKRPVLVPAVHPNQGLQAAYRKGMEAIIAKMASHVLARITTAYRRKPPEMASDASPAVELRDIIEELRRDWERRFDAYAYQAARGFSDQAFREADQSWSGKLRNMGFTVKFRSTRELNDVLQATIAENVALIKSIPEQYFTAIEPMVMQSVQAGRDVGALAKNIEHHFGVTKRRAALIARDQNNKATATITRVRQQELGIEEAVWMHSLGGRKPRPTHVAMNGKRYNVAKGMWDEDEQAWVWPGQLINCRCVSRSVIPGLVAGAIGVTRSK